MKDFDEEVCMQELDLRDCSYGLMKNYIKDTQIIENKLS